IDLPRAGRIAPVPADSPRRPGGPLLRAALGARVETAPGLRRKIPEADRLPVHRERLDEPAVLAVVARCDQDRDLVAGLHHVARVARTVEVARAMAFVLGVARAALLVGDLDDRRRVRVHDVPLLDDAFDRHALTEIEL